MSDTHGKVVTIEGFGEISCECPGCPHCWIGTANVPPFDPTSLNIRCLDCARYVTLRADPGTIETIRVDFPDDNPA